MNQSVLPVLWPGRQPRVQARMNGQHRNQSQMPVGSKVLQWNQLAGRSTARSGPQTHSSTLWEPHQVLSLCRIPGKTVEGLPQNSQESQPENALLPPEAIMSLVATSYTSHAAQKCQPPPDLRCLLTETQAMSACVGTAVSEQIPPRPC